MSRRRADRQRTNLVLGLVLLIVSVSASVGTYIDAQRAETALHNSQDALARARENRQIVQFKLCVGQNELKKVTNRDRETFKAAIRQQKHSLKVLKDPILRSLIATGLARSRKELAARPYLAPLKCSKLTGHVPEP